MDKKIVIIGSGAMGTAIGKVLFDSNQKNIVFYGVDKKELSDLEAGKNSKYFPSSINLPKFKTTNILKEALKEATYIVLAIPSKFMDVIFDDVLKNLDSEVLVVNASKGFYPNSVKSLHEGITDASKANKNVRGVVSLIGPSHAEEIVQEKPTIISVVDKNEDLCKEVQKMFYSPYFKTYIQTDVKGAEAGAAYKNVLAIASGISAGLGYGINTLAALLTRGLSEVLKFNEFLGGKPETIIGLTGVGDLIVTATSDLSRNYSFGKEFVLNGKQALKTDKTIEGLTALKIINEISQKNRLNLPISNLLFKVIFEDYKIDDVVKELWNRSHNSE